MACLVSTIGWFLYRAGDDATEVLARNALTEVMGRVGQGIERQTSGARAGLNVVAPPPAPPVEAGQAPAVLPFPTDRKQLEERLWLANALYEDPSYLYFGGADGSFIGVKQEAPNVFTYSVREPGGQSHVYAMRGPGTEMRLITTQDYEPRERPWYQQAVREGRETWSTVYADYRQKHLGINLSKPIFDADGKLLGVANSSIALLPVTTLLRQLPLSAHGVAFVVEPKGELIGSSVEEPLYQFSGTPPTLLRLNAAQSRAPLVQQAFEEVRGYLATHAPEPGKLVLLGARSQGSKIEVAFRLHHDPAGLNWLAISAAPRSDFLGSVTSGIYQTLLLGVLSVCLTFVIGFLLLRWVLRDIRKLTVAAKSIGNGSPFPSLNIDRNDEIGQLAQSFQEMERSLRTDRLTNVLNRDSLIAQIDFRRRNASQSNPLHFAMLFVDLDRFKSVNDEYGHDEGDRVLITIAERLQHTLRHDDSVARFGGDEFVVYLHGVSEIEVARSIADKIRHAVNKPIEGRDGNEYTVDASFGISLYPDDGLDVETLLRVADSRMFDQKRLHRILSV